MRRTPANQAEIDTIKKTTILDAALEMFSSEGFGGTRVEAVAKKAKVSYGMVYHYYPTKEVLYHMVVQRALDISVIRAQRIPEYAETAYGQINGYIKEFFKQSATNEGAQSLRLLYDVLSSKNIPDITRIYAQERQQQITHALIDLMHRLQLEGYLSGKDPEEMASLLQAINIGHTFLRTSKMGKPLTVEVALSMFC